MPEVPFIIGVVLFCIFSVYLAIKFPHDSDKSKSVETVEIDHLVYKCYPVQDKNNQ